jgi:hypothetical protein
MTSFRAFLVAIAMAAVSIPASAQSSIRCDSPNYQYRYCAAPQYGAVQRVEIQRQMSAAPCVEGRSWGWDSRGVWVTGGCQAMFTIYRGGGGGWAPPSGGSGSDWITCESRNYAYNFCPSNGRVVSASLVNQRSSAPCIQGRSWGWRNNGIWVAEGCEADFRIRSDAPTYPLPPGAGVTVCESHEYRYNFCATGRVRSAQLVQQRSSAPCIQGRTWGWTRDGIWVDQGCEGAFRVN